MILRLVLASLRRRFRQLALILAAVTVAAATVATLAGFSSRAAAAAGREPGRLRPEPHRAPAGGRAGASSPGGTVARLRAVPGVRSAAGLARRWTASRCAPIPAGWRRWRAAIESRVEGVEAVPLRRVSQSDARLTRRLTLVLVAVSAVSFLLALLSVGAATTALVGERRVEIGLLLALGYTGRRVGGFLAAELLAAAVLAGAVGEILGELAAGGLARGACWGGGRDLDDLGGLRRRRAGGGAGGGLLDAGGAAAGRAARPGPRPARRMRDPHAHPGRGRGPEPPFRIAARPRRADARRSTRGSGWPSPAPPAPARPPCSTSSPASTARPPARCASAASTSPGSPPASWRATASGRSAWSSSSST